MNLVKFWLGLLLWGPLLGWGQGKVRGVPVVVSVFNEATAIPFTRLLTVPVHPGMQVGTDWDYKAGTHGRLFQTANLSYYYHAQLNQGIGAHSELGYEYRWRFGLVTGALLGLGYMHTLATTKEYAFQDGQYVERNDGGNSRLYPSLSLDVGYCLRRADVLSPKVFLRYQAWAEFPYSPGFIPVMTHVNLHLGMRFFLVKSRKQNEKN
ncbi:MAG: hypothetical protein U0176_07295 [Bacteroidia bacterium]